MSAAPVRLWRIAGALAIAHVVLMFAGAPSTPRLGATRSDLTAFFVTGSMTGSYVGGFVEYLGFLVFLVGALLLARLLRGRTEIAGWFASCVGGAGIVYAAVTIAAGFSAGAAALYDGHHGAALSTVTTVNDVRNFAYFLSMGVLGLFTLAVAAAVQSTKALPRWLAWAGYPVGVALIGAVPAGRLGWVDFAFLAWVVWFVALAVLALRGPRPASLPQESELATSAR